METETIILENLLSNQEFLRKSLPVIKSEYFHNEEDRVIYDSIYSFVTTYNVAPTAPALRIDIKNKAKVNETVFKKINTKIDEIEKNIAASNPVTMGWLIQTTEEFCREKALYNAIMTSIDIMKNNNKSLTTGAIPTLLSEAIAVTFNPAVGHDYLEDIDDRYKYYHEVQERIPFDLDMFNTITKGGLSRKTLNIILAGTGVGKSLAMCHFAASALSLGKNVLYITLELAEKEVAKRIDANLLNVTFDDLIAMPEAVYKSKAKALKQKTTGKLIIREYPTASASVAHFRALLNELRLKKKFVPDIIFIDYLNICTSARLKRATSNSYEYIKSIAEEIRGLAGEFNLPIVSATQTTRSGFTSSDIGLEDTSESFGLPATADLMFAMISSDELNALNQISIKQLKNRYNDPTKNTRFVVGIDRARMKLFNVSASAQSNIVQTSTPTPTAAPLQMPKSKKPNGNKFKQLKV